MIIILYEKAMRVIIDRFEDRYAVVETNDKKIYNIDKALLAGAKEGDCISITIDNSKNNLTDTQKLFKKLLKDW